METLETMWRFLASCLDAKECLRDMAETWDNVCPRSIENRRQSKVLRDISRRDLLPSAFVSRRIDPVYSAECQ